jgi:hypothetical protein
MDAAQFAERMAQIRARFAAKLNSKIEDTDAALIVAVGDGKKAVEAVAAIYRRFHEVCGIGPTIGFNQTGRVARTLVDEVLVMPFRTERGLTAIEMAKMKEGLEAFKIAARVDMRSTDTGSEHLT